MPYFEYDETAAGSPNCGGASSFDNNPQHGVLNFVRVALNALVNAIEAASIIAMMSAPPKGASRTRAIDAMTPGSCLANALPNHLHPMAERRGQTCRLRKQQIAAVAELGITRKTTRRMGGCAGFLRGSWMNFRRS